MYLLFATALYFISRLPNLTLQPIFCDEATYLDWGWRMVTGDVPFHSLYDAKQPLLMWFFGFAQKFIADPLLAGRLVSVFTGLFTLMGIYKLSSYIFDKKIAVISCFLYPLIPIFLLYDRQALMESAVAAVGIWSVYSLFLLIDHPAVKHALLFGALLALGFWIKSSALLFILPNLLVYFLSIILKPNRILYFNLLILSLCAAIILLMPLFLQTQFWTLYLKYNHQYSLSVSEMLRFPWQLWRTNFIGNLEIIFFQLTPPFLLLLIPGVYLSLKNYHRHSWALIWIFLIPLVLETFSSRATIARYLVSFLPLAIVYTSLVIARIPWLIVTLSLPFSLSLLQILSPANYFIFLNRLTKYSYYTPYVCCFSTGYPVNQAVTYFRQLSQKTPIYVGFYLGVGNPPSAMLAYFRSDPRITPIYMDSLLMGKLIDKTDCLTSKSPLYFLAIQQQQAGLNKYFEYVTTFTNPYGAEDYLNVYTLKKNCTGRSLEINPAAQRS